MPVARGVPVGNGALINGVGSWLRHAAPGCRVVGVQAEAAAAMTLSWRAGHPVDTDSAATYADGIASRVAIPRAVELMRGRVDDMITVSEDALRAAQAELTDELGITVEGAAAASWAGLLVGRAGRRRHCSSSPAATPERRPAPAGEGPVVTAARRYLPSDPADLARSLVPIALLVVAAALPGVRVPVLIALVAGAGIAIAARRPCAGHGRRPCPWRSASCGARWPPRPPHRTVLTAPNLASPVAMWRGLEVVVVLATVATLAVVLKATPASLWLRWPARRWVPWAVAGFLAAGPVALLLGPYLARPFFGEVGYELVFGGLVPALVFAVANGVMEELIYRGALMGWSARVMGLGPAVVGQAVVFGVAHSGADVIGFQLPLMLALGVGGLLAGIITVRT